MVAWWDAMTLAEQVFAVIGIAATILLIIQVILLAIGAGGDSGDVDVHADIGDANADISIDGGSVDINIDAPDVGLDAGSVPGDWYGDIPHDSGVPTDYHLDGAASGLHLFTIQGLVAFFAVFGWSGLLMLKSDLSPVASVLLAILFGFIAMACIGFIFRAMLKLQQDGSLDIKNALGKSGTVYLTIPPSRENKGKVSIMVQDQLLEMDAVTDEDSPVRTGAEVTVIGVSGHNTLIVRPK